MLPASPENESMKSLTKKTTRHRRLPHMWFVLVALLVRCPLAWAGDAAVEVISLPPLQILGQTARAHTQGLELVEGHYYVTARRDDVRPKRALLLRTNPGKADWDVWDITPEKGTNTGAVMDHPGGFQSDGERLWIPLAESRRNGLSIIRVFALSKMIAGQPLQPEFEFVVNDHVGALAVDAQRGRVLGASWDTETVYVWDLEGQLQQTLKGAALKVRGLGVSSDGTVYSGVAVQDWKFVGHRLMASGLFRGPSGAPTDSKSRLVKFDSFLDSAFQSQVVTLPSRKGIEMANEGMDVSRGAAYFLPEDLGETNHLFRVQLADLFP